MCVCDRIYHCVYLALLINLSIYLISPFFPSLLCCLSFHTSIFAFFSAILPVSLYAIVFLPLTPSPPSPSANMTMTSAAYSHVQETGESPSPSTISTVSDSTSSTFPRTSSELDNEFDFLTNGSSELSSNVTQPRLGS
jgi:hypothetical protein